MFAAGKGGRPQSDNCLHTGKGAFVYHDRLWFCLVYYWESSGPSLPAGVRAQHDAYLGGRRERGDRRIAHHALASHRMWHGTASCSRGTRSDGAFGWRFGDTGSCMEWMEGKDGGME